MTYSVPTVSVCVPCYNRGIDVDAAVTSVLAQTYQDFEILIVNDGSTDPETNRLLTGYARPKTRIVQIENRGIAVARNIAVEHSLGRYLCALQPDDRLASTFLERAVGVLERDAQIAFASCWAQVGSEGRVWRPERCDLATLLRDCTVATAALVRLSAVRETRGYDPAGALQGHEFWDLWISLVERGLEGRIVPEVLLHTSRVPGSISDTGLHGDAHLNLVRYLVSKHEGSYSRHLLDLMIEEEDVSCELLKASYALERQIDSRLVPTVERRRLELRRLQERLLTLEERQRTSDRLLARVVELEAALADAQSETSAVLQSRSWRITAPFRAARQILWRLGRTDSRPPEGPARPVGD